MNLMYSNITAHQASQGGTFASTGDIYVNLTDRETGYIEINVAKEGDSLTIVEFDSTCDDGSVRVKSEETGDVFTVGLNDLELF